MAAATMMRRVTWCMVRAAAVQLRTVQSARPFLNVKKPSCHLAGKRLVLAGGGGGGGILTFFGLDEDARLEKKYSEEVEGTQEADFEEELKNTIKRGILNMQKGEHDKAENILHIALRMATEMNHQNAVTYIYDLMANLAYEMGDYQKAERLFISVMQRLIGMRGMAQNDDAIVEMALKLAAIHAKTDRPQLAEQGYAFCIQTQGQKLKEGDNDDEASSSSESSEDDDKEALKNTRALYGMSRDWYGQFLMAQGRVAAAKVQFEEALDASVKVSGNWSEQTINLQNSLATCLSMLGQVSEADALFAQVVMKARSLESDQLASYLVNRGLHQVQAKMFSQAKRSCTEAYGMARRSGDRDPHVLQQSKLCLDKVKAKKTLGDE